MGHKWSSSIAWRWTKSGQCRPDLSRLLIPEKEDYKEMWELKATQKYMGGPIGLPTYCCATCSPHLFYNLPFLIKMSAQIMTANSSIWVSISKDSKIHRSFLSISFVIGPNPANSVNLTNIEFCKHDISIILIQKGDYKDMCSQKATQKYMGCPPGLPIYFCVAFSPHISL